MTQEIFIQLCEVVGYMHKMGVCHLDLKPDNILVSDSKVVLIDFNTASKCQSDGSVQKGAGLRQWSSPESRTQLIYNGALSDSWSVGLVLSYLISGIKPNPNIGAKEQSLAALTVTAVQPFREILERLLRVDPAERMSVEECLHYFK